MDLENCKDKRNQRLEFATAMKNYLDYYFFYWIIIYHLAPFLTSIS